MKRALVCTVSWVLVVVCGIAAQEVGSKDSAGGKAGPSASSAGVAAEQKYGPPAAINEYKGMQEREEVFEFTEKPKVTKEGEKWIVAFASKGKCDATVSIVDKDGKVIRHLASGVLGSNAPHPFQQNSLSQKIEWDGLTDGFKKADVTGCRVKVGLGLRAKFERNIFWDPQNLSQVFAGRGGGRCFTATGGDGNIICFAPASLTSPLGRIYDKDGKYVKTFWPPPAAELEKTVAKFASADPALRKGAQGLGFVGTTKTIWGDAVPTYQHWEKSLGWDGGKRQDCNKAFLPLLFGNLEIKESKTPPETITRHCRLMLPPPDPRLSWWAVYGYFPKLAADPLNERLFITCLDNIGVIWLDGNTGDFLGAGRVDRTKPESKLASGEALHFGPDGFIYARQGPYARNVTRYDRQGKVVPFKFNARPADRPASLPKEAGDWGSHAPGALLTGDLSSGGAAQPHGFDVNAAGNVVVMCSNSYDAAPIKGFDPANEKHLDVAMRTYSRARGRAKELGLEQYKSYAIGVWDSDGRRLTQTAVELPEGDWKMMDCFMDRDGSIYMGVGAGLLPEGIADDGLPGHLGQNSIVKFRGQGGKYPLGKVAIDNKSAPPAGALKLKGGFATGALWAYPVNTFPARCCACKQERPSLDPWARLWIPANHICSVWVIDSNGNRMARIGKYGNVDDTEADLKEERDGVRFCNVGTVTTSDTAMYALDEGNRRILKAALNFAAEETAPLP